MNLRRIRGVLFDLDGTLTRPGAINFAAIKREIDCPREIPILEYLETLPAASRGRFQRVLEEREEEAAAVSLPNEGAESCLLALKARAIPFGILTRNSLKAVRIALGRFETVRMDDFAAVLTREDSPPKPHPGGVFEAAARMGIPVPALMFVGDFRFDILAGKAAGCCSVLLSNGKEPVMAPDDPTPDVTVAGLGEILEFLF
jgi:HAD superfamily hydrolase (TIGR01509 family)